MISDQPLIDALLLIAILAPSIILHEVSHGLVALRLGDPTARDAGRLTLNPIKHVDPFGSLLLPGMLAIANQPVFGWAKPVPVNPRFFRNPTTGMAVTALSGPATNLMLAAVLVRFAPLVENGGVLYRTSDSMWGLALIAAATVNVALAVFNMLPIPPLDGSRLLPLVLSAEGRRMYAQVSQYGFLILFALIFLFDGALGFLSDWIYWILRLLV